jgi:membrane-associated protease RseP (regulator of RpoE activity)
MIIGIIAFAAVMIVAMLADLESKRAKKSPAPPSLAPLPSQTSILAGFSFWSGLAAIIMVTASAVLKACLSMDEITGIPDSVHAPVELAGKIVLYASLLPAVCAAAMALAARGSINESRGALRGRSLYRSALFLSILSGVLVFDAKVVNPASWIHAGAPGGAGGAGSALYQDAPNRGFLGVEHQAATAGEGIRILRVLPGTPAERAGLKAGDRIIQIDDVPVASGDSLANRIGSLEPGTKVELSVRRGDETLPITAVLTAPFSSLFETLQAQETDSSRLSVLLAAGSERRYTAAELRQICGTFSTDTQKIPAIKQALPYLTDPENAYQILNALVTGSAKAQVSRMIADLPRPPK